MPQPPDATLNAPASRDRILAAARALAIERGPGNVSIDAVAHRAGLSKGGVLYHFRTKADLLAAIVAGHVETTHARIEAALGDNAAAPNALASALVEAHRQETALPMPPPSGVLAAVAEHPDFLDPVRAHQSDLASRLHRDSSDPDLATIVYLALEGLKAQRLFGITAIDGTRETALLDRMAALVSSDPATPPP